jgi:FlaA1/EpsC-like NDP-sugar epimerase
VSNEAVRADSRCLWPSRTFSLRRAKFALEAGYDTAAWLTGILAAAWLTDSLSDAQFTLSALFRLAVSTCLLVTISGVCAGLYRHRYERGSLDEVAGTSLAACLMSLALLLLRTLSMTLAPTDPRTVAGAAVFAVTGMLAGRYMVFGLRYRTRVRATAATNVIVFGAGSAGTALVRRLVRDPASKYRPVAILDDNPDKRRLRIQGIPVRGNRSRMGEVAAMTGARVLVIAIAGASGTAIRDLSAQAEQCGLAPKVIPSLNELLSGRARIEGVRDPRISDLLGRRPVQTDITAITGRFEGKRILVTGAGGSIGAELCRQLHHFRPAELIMLDRDESALHAVQLALHGRALLDSDETVLADIRDARRVQEVFQHARPHIVFHAAALKHLPLLERYPAEAVKSNVLGTQIVLEAAAACGVESFVNISTDKAADPVSVLGYSKRIGERLTAHMASQSGGTYLSVRFGNVLGSRGSVLTALSVQVDNGGPVTVTHPDVTRYFMTVDEAVQLVLQAAVIGGSGEVLVLDMGEPVRIADIARRLAAGSPRPVDIVFTGLRPGEKLVEDLLGHDEVDHRPHHPLIRHARVTALHPDRLADFDLSATPDCLRKALSSCVDDREARMPTQAAQH